MIALSESNTHLYRDSTFTGFNISRSVDNERTIIVNRGRNSILYFKRKFIFFLILFNLLLTLLLSRIFLALLSVLIIHRHIIAIQIQRLFYAIFLRSCHNLLLLLFFVRLLLLLLLCLMLEDIVNIGFAETDDFIVYHGLFHHLINVTDCSVH